MKTQRINLNFIAGLMLMSIPAAFFVSVILEQFFNYNFFVESIFVPIDKTSSLLSAFLLLGLPFIALCINILPVINFHITNANDELKISFNVKKKVLNIMIICIALLSIMTLLGYLFMENFTSR